MIIDYDIVLSRLMKSLYPDEYFEAATLPKPYSGTEPIKGIILGADPTYLQDNGSFKIVFGLENADSKFFRPIKDNLVQIGLSLENFYVQNLIKSYFKHETSKNKIWEKSARLWLENLKRELDAQFKRDIPLLITAEIILNVTVFKEHLIGVNPKLIYSRNMVFSPDQNYFGRNIIALFRHYAYQLKKWPEYAARIKRLLPF
jgi:hypothetical protein